MKKIITILTIMVWVNVNAQYTKLLDFNTTNGTQPFGSVVLSANDSVLYGMTNGGGSISNTAGTVYSIHTDGTGYTNLHNFTAANTSGAWPYGSLIRSGNVLYGMTSGYGTYNMGNIFSINTDGTGYMDLFDFGGVTTNTVTTSDSTSGANPYGTLTLVGNVLYGMTYGAGGPDMGNIFSIHTDGTAYTTLLEFNGTNGEHPGYGALTISGNIMYGTTLYGGANSQGNLFSIHTDGSGYTNLIDFNTANGSMPFGSVVLLGNVLYGNTSGGGLYSKGLIYSIHTDGTGYRDLFDFNGTNGQGPAGSLILSGGTLYGTTGSGGVNSLGTIFSIDTNGTGYRDLFDFNTPFGTQPRAQLSQAGNTLYGTAVTGGTYGDGVVFSLNLLPAAPTICMVTTDSSTNYKYNVIYWDKAGYNNVDSFIVYRYNPVSSNYARIGSVSNSALSAFTDTAFSIGGPNGGNPQYGSWEYKLAIRDTLGNIGAMSPYHQTMFVQQNNSNFSWNAYAVGAGQTNPVTGYSFLRDDNNTGAFHVLANLANTSVSTTDPNYSSFPNGNWRIDALGFSCTPTARLAANNSVQSTYARAHSNTTKTAATGIEKYNVNNNLNIYPNPSNGSFVIETNAATKQTMQMYDVNGKLVLSQSINGKSNIDASGLNEGIYNISIISNEGVVNKRVVIVR